MSLLLLLNQQAGAVAHTRSLKDALRLTDSFSRTEVGGIGQSEQGIDYHQSGEATHAVNVGSGVLTVQLNAAVTAYAAGLYNQSQTLNEPSNAYDGSTSIGNVRARVKFKISALPVGNSTNVEVMARAFDTDHRIRLSADFRVAQGDVRLELIEENAGNTNLAAATGAIAVAAANTDYWLELIATGSNPTALEGRIWAASGSRPSAAQVSFSYAAATQMQNPAGAGLRAYLSSGATTGVTVTFDDFSAEPYEDTPAPTVSQHLTRTATDSVALGGADWAPAVDGQDDDTTNQSTPYVTPNIAWLPDTIYLVPIVARSGVTFTADPNLSGGGATWTIEKSRITGRYLGVFRGKTSSSPGTGPLTVDFGGISLTACMTHPIALPGADASGTDAAAIVQSVVSNGGTTGSAGTRTVTLTNPPSADNAVVAAWFPSTVEMDVTPGSGFTQISEGTVAGPSSTLMTEWRTGSTSQSVDASFAADSAYDVVAIEVKKAVGAAADSIAILTGTARTATDTTSVTDDPVRVIGTTRTATDTTSVTDALARVVGLPRTATDTTSVTDALARVIAFHPSISDTVTGTDSLARLLAVSRLLLDAGGFAEQFNTDATNGWGTGWTASGGSAANFSVTNGIASISQAAANSARGVVRGSFVDARTKWRFRHNQPAAGGPLYVFAALRRIDSANYYRAVLRIETGGGLSLQLERVRLGGTTVLQAYTAVGSAAVGSWFWVEAELVGADTPSFRARVWVDGASVPAWQREIDDAGPVVSGSGAVGVRTDTDAAYSGTLPILFEFDDFSAVEAGSPVARVLGAARPLTETLTTSDDLARTLGATRQPADTTAVTDSISHSVESGAQNLTRTAEDTTSVTDSLNRLQGLARGPPDTVTTTESVDRLVAATRAATDTTSVTDSADPSAAHARTADDTTAVTDQVDRLGVFTRTAEDTTSVTDALNQGIIRRAEDTVVTTDAVARSGVFTRAISDDVSGLTDAVDARTGVIRQAEDTTTVTDSVAAPKALFRTADDSVTTTDTVTGTSTHERQAEDTTSVTDSISTVAQPLRTAEDTTTVTDAVEAVSTHPRTADDNVETTDSLANASAHPRTAEDATTIADEVAPTATHPRTAEDTTSVTDSVASPATHPRSLDDTTSVTDEIASPVAFYRTAEDTTTVTDAIAATTAQTREADDTTTVTDEASRFVGAVRDASESLTTSDQIERLVGASRAAEDTTAVTDSAERALAAARQAEDTTSVTEQVDRAGVFTRAISDSVPIGTDTIDTGSADKQRALSDTIPIGADTVDRLAALHVAADETLTTVDALQSATGASRSAEDATTVDETVARRIDHFRGISESIPTTDEIASAAGYARAAEDTTSVDDTVVRLAALTRQADDATTTTDSVSAATEGSVAVTDTVATTDAVGRLLNATRQAADSTTTTDSLAGRSGLQRAAEDATAVTDEVSVRTGVAATATDTLTTTDAVVRRVDHYRAVADSAPATDSLARAVTTSRTAEDTTTVTDAVTGATHRVASASDTTSVTDEVERRVGVRRTATDTRSTTDAIARRVGRLLTAADFLTTSDSLLYLTNTFVPTVKADVQSHHVGRNNATASDGTAILVGTSQSTGNGSTRIGTRKGVEVRVRASSSRRVAVRDD